MALPMAVLAAYLLWLGGKGEDQMGAASAEKANQSNRVIAVCVGEEIAAGRTGTACIGRFARPCQRREDMRSQPDQVECTQREFVLWTGLMNGELRAFKALISDEKKRTALARSQALWRAYHQENCRLAYALLSDAALAERTGSWCSLRLTAYRALELSAWRRRLSGQ